MVYIKFSFLFTVLSFVTICEAFSGNVLLQSHIFGTTSRIRPKKVPALGLVRTRGLEIRTEGATPAPGDMTLYIKAGQDGKSVGDCPFAHYVQMVLYEKGLPFTVIPSVQETKPDWLIDFYGGSMPALRHRKECYIESDVIAQYLDFFFTEPKLSGYSKDIMNEAADSVEGFFPALAKYLKSTSDGGTDDLELKESLKQALNKIEEQLNNDVKTGPYLAGNGEDLTILDCALAPKLYHMSVGLEAFKSGEIDVDREFPLVKSYMHAIFDRESFKKSSYPEETIIWGWSNARN